MNIFLPQMSSYSRLPGSLTLSDDTAWGLTRMNSRMRKGENKRIKAGRLHVKLQVYVANACKERRSSFSWYKHKLQHQL